MQFNSISWCCILTTYHLFLSWLFQLCHDKCSTIKKHPLEIINFISELLETSLILKQNTEKDQKISEKDKNSLWLALVSFYDLIVCSIGIFILSMYLIWTFTNKFKNTNASNKPAKCPHTFCRFNENTSKIMTKISPQNFTKTWF